MGSLISNLWNTFLYEPIYNALIFIINDVTFGDVGLAIIIVTIIVKVILLPLTRKSVRSQVMMKKMEPELKKIKQDYPNKEEQAKKTLELYKKYGTNPFSGCLVVLLQMPVIFALYYVFYRGLVIDESLIYSFVQVPTHLSTNFLGLIELSEKSLFLGVLTGLTQFVQGYLSSPKKNKAEIIKDKTEIKDNRSDFQGQLSESMQMNVRYILPIFIGFIAWKISAAVALYWTVSNIFTILQEWYVRRKLVKDVL